MRSFIRGMLDNWPPVPDTGGDSTHQQEGTMALLAMHIFDRVLNPFDGQTLARTRVMPTIADVHNLPVVLRPSR